MWKFRLLFHFRSRSDPCPLCFRTVITLAPSPFSNLLQFRTVITLATSPISHLLQFRTVFNFAPFESGDGAKLETVRIKRRCESGDGAKVVSEWDECGAGAVRCVKKTKYETFHSIFIHQ